MGIFTSAMNHLPIVFITMVSFFIIFSAAIPFTFLKSGFKI